MGNLLNYGLQRGLMRSLMLAFEVVPDLPYVLTGYWDDGYTWKD